jgi:hypothetical protein
MKRAWCVSLLVIVAGLVGCGKQSENADKAEVPAPPAQAVESSILKSYPLDTVEGVIAQDGVALDASTSADGKGSLVLTAEEPTTFRLFETGDLDVEDARIIYRAKLRTEGVEGRVYLEMWCSFPGVGEAFSRALQSPLSGTMEWTSQETPFFLKAGENPDNVKLNVVIEGTGRAWVDDIRLEKGPLGDI